MEDQNQNDKIVIPEINIRILENYPPQYYIDRHILSRFRVITVPPRDQDHERIVNN
jgi:hypothetical protein